MKASAPRTIFLLEVCLLDELAAGYTKSKSLLCLEIKQYIIGIYTKTVDSIESVL